MGFFKDAAGGVHFLQSDDSRALLPVDAVPITDAEAHALMNPPMTQAELDAEQTAAALADLREIDLASIRGLREWVAAQPGTPVQLVQHEQDAQAARGRIKP